MSCVSIPIHGSFVSTIERIYDMRFRSFLTGFLYHFFFQILFWLILLSFGLRQWFRRRFIAFWLIAVNTLPLIIIHKVNFVLWFFLIGLCCKSSYEPFNSDDLIFPLSTCSCTCCRISVERIWCWINTLLDTSVQTHRLISEKFVENLEWSDTF